MARQDGSKALIVGSMIQAALALVLLVAVTGVWAWMWVPSR
jgi:hypothetical protein